LTKKKKNHQNKKPEYYGQHELIDLQNKFIAQYDYNFWMHKAHVLNHFINNPESPQLLKFQADIAADEVIVQGLKMELHMTAMHCTESFFRVFYAMLYSPDIPWIGMAQCPSDELYVLIRSIQQEGITSLVSNANAWLRSSLYPSIDEKHDRYERSKISSDFVIAYLQRLAHEFVEHKEYNSYKHGLHCFPGTQTIQAFGEQNGKKYLDSTNDVIEFLEFGKTESKGRKKVVIATKTFSNIKDYNIIMTNSAILHNILMFKSLAAANRMRAVPEDSPIFHGYYYFDDRNVGDTFLDGDTSGPIKKFTF
jgi:hypothetical protein